MKIKVLIWKIQYYRFVGNVYADLGLSWLIYWASFGFSTNVGVEEGYWENWNGPKSIKKGVFSVSWRLKLFYMLIIQTLAIWDVFWGQTNLFLTLDRPLNTLSRKDRLSKKSFSADSSSHTKPSFRYRYVKYLR